MLLVLISVYFLHTRIKLGFGFYFVLILGNYIVFVFLVWSSLIFGFSLTFIRDFDLDVDSTWG